MPDTDSDYPWAEPSPIPGQENRPYVAPNAPTNSGGGPQIDVPTERGQAPQRPIPGPMAPFYYQYPNLQILPPRLNQDPRAQPQFQMPQYQPMPTPPPIPNWLWAYQPQQQQSYHPQQQANHLFDYLNMMAQAGRPVPIGFDVSQLVSANLSGGGQVG